MSEQFCHRMVRSDSTVFFVPASFVKLRDMPLVVWGGLPIWHSYVVLPKE
jgi:hypothetical protein